MKTVWKIYKLVSIVFFTALIIDIVIVLFFAFYQPAVKKSDAIIVLGAAINTPALYNRSLVGLDLYEQGKGDVVVLSGGRISDKDISEAGYMKKVITAHSSSTVTTLIEDQSHNTYENLKNSKKLIPNANSLIVVSDEFHLARAVLLAKRQGFHSVYWASPRPNYYKKTELAFYFVREIIAMGAYIPKFIFG